MLRLKQDHDKAAGGHHAVDGFAHGARADAPQDGGAEVSPQRHAGDGEGGAHKDVLRNDPVDGAQRDDVDVRKQKIRLDGGEVGLFFLRRRGKIQAYRRPAHRKQSAHHAAERPGQQSVRSACLHPDAFGEKNKVGAQTDQKNAQHDFQRVVCKAGGIAYHKPGHDKIGRERHCHQLPAHASAVAEKNPARLKERHDVDERRRAHRGIHGKGHDHHGENAEAEAADHIDAAADAADAKRSQILHNSFIIGRNAENASGRR